ncbi:MAG: hypothetical protein RL719_765 [Actinomycetota bacterium]|jgi:hypothetical protein
MKLNLKKIASYSLAVALGLSGVLATSVPANAAAASGEAYISLITPVITDDMISMKADNQKMADGWIANTWFGSGLTFTKTWAPAGSTITVTYHVADKSGNPFINKDVKLRVGKGYSGSTAIVSVDGLKTNGIDKAPLDQADPIRKTDSFGNVSFTLVNLNAPAEGEPMPAKWTDDTIPSTSLNALYCQLLPEVYGEKPDHSVMTEFHYYKPSSATANGPTTAPSLKVLSPVLNDSNSLARTDLAYASGATVRQVYVPTGGNVYLGYSVKDDKGAPAVNQSVKLRVNTGGSSSTAKITDGTTATKTGSTDGAVLTGTTDAFGSVVFHLTNTDSKGETAPATPTTKAPTKGAVFSAIVPELAGAKDQADRVELHFANPGPGVSAAAAPIPDSSGKFPVVITLTGTPSSSVSVTVTGVAKATKKLSTAGKFTYSVSLSPGSKTVTAVIGGKTYKATVTVG